MSISVDIADSKLSAIEHQGKLYYVNSVLTSQSSAVTFLWRTGAKEVHFTSALSSTLKTTYTITEGVTVTATGTAGKLYNRNRNFSDDGMVFTRYTTPTATGGTVISTQQTGASSAPGVSSMSPASVVEAALKRNTDYLVTVTPSASCDINISILFWED